MLTIGETLQTAKKSIASRDAQSLLCAVLKVERAYVLAHPEHRLTAEQSTRYDVLVKRCAAGEPLPYLLGRWAFYDRDFMVSPAVLIPRPETELLLEEALAFVREQPRAAVVDVGTGSGALAVTLAALYPQASVYATDISSAALEVARQNAEHYQAAVAFFQGDLLTPLIERGLQVDLVLANLPYIASSDLPALAVSRYEPLLALDGGPDGLDVIRRLLGQLASVCRPRSLILLEIGADQGPAALQLAQTTFPLGKAQVLPDLAGHDRLVRVHLGV